MSQSVVSILEATRSAPPPYPAPGCDANPLQVTPSILMHIHHSFTLLGRERHCENKVYCQTTQCNKPAMMQTQTSSPTVQWTECKGGKKVLKGHSISHIGYCVYLKSVLSVLLKLNIFTNSNYSDLVSNLTC